MNYIGLNVSSYKCNWVCYWFISYIHRKMDDSLLCPMCAIRLIGLIEYDVRIGLKCINNLLNVLNIALWMCYKWNISSRYSNNSEAFASELLEYFEENISSVQLIDSDHEQHIQSLKS